MCDASSESESTSRSADTQGLAAGIPTIGVAKTFLHVDGLDAHGVRRAADAQREEKDTIDWLPLVGESGRVRTLRS